MKLAGYVLLLHVSTVRASPPRPSQSGKITQAGQLISQLYLGRQLLPNHEVCVVLEPIDIETVRTEALKKLGRNIVNFSKIEGGLKYLLSISQVSGPITTFTSQVLENQHKRRKHTLGKLVTEFNKNILGNAKQAKPPETVSEPWLTISLKADSPAIATKKWRQTLQALVAERNRLIHQELAHLDTTSIEDYRRLINLLDEQNPRLLAHLDDLKWMVESFNETIQALRSPEFLQVCTSPKGSA